MPARVGGVDEAGTGVDALVVAGAASISRTHIPHQCHAWRVAVCYVLCSYYTQQALDTYRRVST